MCHCDISVSAYTFRRALQSQAEGVFHICHHIGVAPISTLRTHPTLVAEPFTAHFVNSRVTASTRRAAEEASLLASGKRRDPLADQLIHFSLILRGRHGIVSCFLRCYICVTLLEIMLRRVLVHLFTLETQQVSMNFALDYASPGKLVTNTSKQCQKSVMDCVAQSVAAQEVGFDNL